MSPFIRIGSIDRLYDAVICIPASHIGSAHNIADSLFIIQEYNIEIGFINFNEFWGLKSSAIVRFRSRDDYEILTYSPIDNRYTRTDRKISTPDDINCFKHGLFKENENFSFGSCGLIYYIEHDSVIRVEQYFGRFRTEHGDCKTAENFLEVFNEYYKCSN